MTPVTVSRSVSAISMLWPIAGWLPKIRRAHSRVMTTPSFDSSTRFGSPSKRRNEKRSKKVESANIGRAEYLLSFHTIGNAEPSTTTGQIFSISG